MKCSRRLRAATQRRCRQTVCRFITCRRHCRGPFAFTAQRHSGLSSSNR
jgi:hypothetical protein